MSTPRYYYANATQESIGPLELAALQALAQTGVISPNTPVIAEGEASWSTAGQLGLLPPKKKRSLLRNVSMGCAGVFVGYLAIAVLSIIVLQALGSKVAPHEAVASADSQGSTGQPQELDPDEVRFEGYCVNETYGAKATMSLALHQTPNGFVGELTLTGDLSGGGPLTGHIEDNKVYFTSRSEDGLEITWVSIAIYLPQQNGEIV